MVSLSQYALEEIFLSFIEFFVFVFSAAKAERPRVMIAQKMENAISTGKRSIRLEFTYSIAVGDLRPGNMNWK